MPTVSSSGQKSIDTMHWVGWADQDYVGARILLLTGFVVQGAVLACTAVEKYLKAVCTLSGVPFEGVGHDVPKLNGLLHHKIIPLHLNVKFLRFLNKAYKLRYPDELAPGFNVALNSIAILIELDTTVHVIRAGFTFKRNGNSVTTKLEESLKNHTQELLTKNCALAGADKKQMYAEPSWAYDLMPDGTVMEASYVVSRLLDEDNFTRNGFSPVEGSQGRSFKLAWPPQPPEKN
jgi:HEPN domain-containing protein